MLELWAWSWDLFCRLYGERPWTTCQPGILDTGEQVIFRLRSSLKLDIQDPLKSLLWFERFIAFRELGSCKAIFIIVSLMHCISSLLQTRDHLANSALLAPAQIFEAEKNSCMWSLSFAIMVREFSRSSGSSSISSLSSSLLLSTSCLASQTPCPELCYCSKPHADCPSCLRQVFEAVVEGSSVFDNRVLLNPVAATSILWLRDSRPDPVLSFLFQIENKTTQRPLSLERDCQCLVLVSERDRNRSGHFDAQPLLLRQIRRPARYPPTTCPELSP